MKPAGHRDTLLTLWREVSSVPGASDNTGQMVASYQKIGNAWGSVTSAQPPPNAAGIKGQTEEWASYHMNVNAKYVITIDYRGDLQATDRFTEVSARTGT